MSTLRYVVADVFTDTPLEGNPLGVFTDAREIPDGLMQRLAREQADKTIFTLDPLVCPCSTMFRIDGPHLAWVLDNLVAGEVVNQIVVDPVTAKWARVALERMLEIT